MRKLTLTLSFFFGMNAMANVDIKPASTQQDQKIVTRMQQNLAPCLTTIGAVPLPFPLGVLPPAAQLAVRVELVATGPKIADGYRYYLVIHQSRKQVYVQQIGGLAGTQKTYGPLGQDTKCAP